MTTQYWLVKTEPEAYAWSDFVRDGRTTWGGVRNFQARNHLRAMHRGDVVLFYASVTTKAVLGTATVGREHFADPTATEGDWSAVELVLGETFPTPVTLEAIKADSALRDLPLIKQSRLSVMPLTRATYERIVALGRAPAPAPAASPKKKSAVTLRR
jgi:predicted RNA-binding protein with PUA-like domain